MNITGARSLHIGLDEDGDLCIEVVGACGCCAMRAHLMNEGDADRIIAELQFHREAARARKRGAMVGAEGGRA